MKRILLTGAGGGIGKRMRQALAGRYPVLRVTDMVDLGAPGPGEEIELADLTRAEDLARIVDGVTTA